MFNRAVCVNSNPNNNYKCNKIALNLIPCTVKVAVALPVAPIRSSTPFTATQVYVPASNCTVFSTDSLEITWYEEDSEVLVSALMRGYSMPIPLADVADTAVPSGRFHEIVGVGTPKASHVSTAPKEMFTTVFMGATTMLAGSGGSRKDSEVMRAILYHSIKNLNTEISCNKASPMHTTFTRLAMHGHAGTLLRNFQKQLYCSIVTQLYGHPCKIRRVHILGTGVTVCAFVVVVVVAFVYKV